MKKKDTKTRIVETAYSLFHQYNYQSVTVMDMQCMPDHETDLLQIH